MKWFKGQHKEGRSIDQVVFLLLNLTRDTVKATSQTLRKYLNAEEQSKLTKIEDELFLFFLFALDYWWQIEQAHTQEDKHTWGAIFGAHLRILFGGDPEGLAMFDTFQERNIAYAEIVNQKKDDSAKFFGLGRQLSEFCDMPGNPFLLLLAPDLFTKALESVSSFRR